uniref:Cysteine and tyrosine-rich protein 1 n=1 Tax=Plectus sambesii TaxID=2011161 RepID=A0A914WBQ3_9BILA
MSHHHLFFNFLLCTAVLISPSTTNVATSQTTASYPLQCFDTMQECTKTCEKDCLPTNDCNGESNKFICLPFSAGLFFALMIAISIIVFMCCCGCAIGIIYCIIRKSKRRTDGQVIFRGNTTVVHTSAPSHYK